MNEASYDAATALVPKTYVTQGRDARRTHEKHIQMLIQQVQYIKFVGTHHHGYGMPMIMSDMVVTYCNFVTCSENCLMKDGVM